MFDRFILANAFACLLGFIILQFFIFRLIKADAVLKGLMNLLNIFLVLNISIGIFFTASQQVEFLPGLTLTGLSAVLYGLLAFLYVLIIFGPYESSVRLRILRELYRTHPQGLTEEQLLSRYNAQTVIKRRLERLIRSKDIIHDGGRYRLGKRFNFFILSDRLVTCLEKLISG